MTDGTSSDSDANVDAAGALASERRGRLESAVGDALASRDGAAFVHVGAGADPALAYCRSALEGAAALESSSTSNAALERTATVAIGYDGGEWLVRRAEGATHPAARLAEALAERAGGPGTVLTPATIPHDAALYLENEGFELASTDAVARARAEKTAVERDRIATVQAAASAGIRRGAALLTDATVDSDGDAEDERLAVDGDPLTAERLRVAVDEAIVTAGAFPAGNTAVSPGGDLRPGEPIVVAVAPRGADGYHGRLVRTFVVDSDGGRERRAHVAVTQAFRSSQAMLTAEAESVTAVEADLEAEIRAFGEDGRVETRVAGVGLEPDERPIDGADDVAPGSVVRLEAAVELESEDETETANADGSWIRLADVLEKREDGISWLEAPSRSLEPTALLG